MRLVRAFLAAALVALAARGGGGRPRAGAPAGVHLSLGARDDEMIVTWATFAPLASPTVRFGPLEDGAEDDAAARARARRDARAGRDDARVQRRRRGPPDAPDPRRDADEPPPGREVRVARRRRRRSRRGRRRPLLGRRVGGADPASSWSAPFAFTAKRTPEQIARSGDPLTFLAVCDIGHEESASLLKLLASEVRGAGKCPDADAPRPPDFLAHCGDFAYDLDDDDGAVGDAFMRDIEPIAAYVPYMTTAGNHEAAYNFSHYAARFEMPGATARATENQYYSFDYGPAHFVAWNTEAFFFPEYFDEAYMARMYAWLEEDAAAREREPRERAVDRRVLAQAERDAWRRWTRRNRTRRTTNARRRSGRSEALDPRPPPLSPRGGRCWRATRTTPEGGGRLDPVARARDAPRRILEEADEAAPMRVGARGDAPRRALAVRRRARPGVRAEDRRDLRRFETG